MNHSSKLKLSDFCDNVTTYSQLIQNLFLHINVTDLYMTLIQYAAKNKDIYNAQTYKHTYSTLKDKIPNLQCMTVGDLLQFAEEESFHINSDDKSDSKTENIELGILIVKSLLVDLFQFYAEKEHVSYDSVLDGLKRRLSPPRVEMNKNYVIDSK